MVYKLIYLVYVGFLLGQCILVVDDVEEDCMLLLDFLLCYGVWFYVVCDGQDGYCKVQIVWLDLILMDICMLVYDGFISVCLFKVNFCMCNILLIFFLVVVFIEEKVNGLSVGVVDYIIKFFDFEEVWLCLCVYLCLILYVDLLLIMQMFIGFVMQGGFSIFDMVLFQVVCWFMMDKLDQLLGFNVLVVVVGINVCCFFSVFKYCVGVIVFDFLCEECMKEVCCLFFESIFDIGVIVLVLGYSNMVNFFMVFCECFGMLFSQFWC